MDDILRNSIERVVKVKLQPLTAEAFAPYGSVLDLGAPLYPEMEDGGRRAMVKARVRRKPGPQSIDTIATHFAYNQQFMVLKGVWAIVVAPPPRNPDAACEDFEFDYDHVAAFIMEPGDCVDVAAGVWHNGLALTEEVLQMTLTRTEVGKDEFRPTEDVVGGVVPVSVDPEQQRMQATVDYVNLKKRDNCVLEVVM